MILSPHEYCFWMVWNPSGHAPTMRHSSPISAEQEATRLARNNKGQEFFVLMATDRYCSNDVHHTKLADLDERPF